ncbi:RNA polymerase sigma factor SigZ [Rhodovibrionaceae bacterium A322]
MNSRQIWNDYQASLKAFLHARLSNPADVEDLLQDILIKSHQNLGTLAKEGSLKSWLFQIANRTLIDHYRQQGKARDLQPEDLWYGDGSESQTPPGPGGEDSVQQDLARCLLPFIRQLPPAQAEALRAVELEGKSQKAYAAEQGISYSTLKSRIQAGRKVLRGQYESCCRFSISARGDLLDYQQKQASGCKSC